MSYQITIEPIGQTVEVREGQTVLDACLRAGVWLPHACCHGLCATCKVQVLEGDCDHGEARPIRADGLRARRGQDPRLLRDAAVRPRRSRPTSTRTPTRNTCRCEDYLGEVVEARLLTPTIRGLWLKPNRPVRFQAGQYLMLDVPGVAGARAFSIASTAGRRTGRAAHPPRTRGSRHGLAARAVKAGDRLAFSGRSGASSCASRRRAPMIFVAGGSGLSSPKSMVVDLLAEGCTSRSCWCKARAIATSCTSASFSSGWSSSMRTSATCRCCRMLRGRSGTAPRLRARGAQGRSSTTTSAATRPICAGRRR